MIEKVVSVLAGFIIAVISHLGYGGIALLMGVESACIPMPSEVIMPFSGYLVFKGDLALWAVALAGAIGCLLGSWVAYAAGAFGGRPLAERYGRYLLISSRELHWADYWFQRYGGVTVFIGRLLPVVRTFISFPAGMARMPLWRFSFYTFVGSFIWCLGLAWVGFKLGEHWDTLGVYFHRFDEIIVAVAVIAVILYIWSHVRNVRA